MIAAESDGVVMHHSLDRPCSGCSVQIHHRAFPMTIDLDSHRFNSTQACLGAGIEMATLKNWISRDPPAILIGPEDKKAFGTREFFRFSFRRVMQIALTAELVGYGFSPRHAGTLAAGYTDVGDSVTVWGDEPVPEARGPGEQYPTGYTVLIAHRDDETSEITNVQIGAAWDPFQSQHGLRAGAVVLNVTTLQWEVLRRLGFDRNGQPFEARS